MIQLNRPLSPHLYSYKPQITSLFSIFHRISGFFLSFCLLFNSFFFIFVCCFVSFRYFFIGFYVISLVYIYIYYILLITIFFHFLNGIRHLFWDFCLGLDLNNIFLTACAVLSMVTLLIIFFLVI